MKYLYLLKIAYYVAYYSNIIWSIVYTKLVFKKMRSIHQSLDEEVTPRNYIIILDDLTPCHISIGRLAEWTPLLKLITFLLS